MVHQKQTRQVEGEFDMEIVSLIVQQLHAGVISLLPFVRTWLILLNLVSNYKSDLNNKQVTFSYVQTSHFVKDSTTLLITM